jgi:hypothetical protein
MGASQSILQRWSTTIRLAPRTLEAIFVSDLPLQSSTIVGHFSCCAVNTKMTQYSLIVMRCVFTRLIRSLNPDSNFTHNMVATQLLLTSMARQPTCQNETLSNFVNRHVCHHVLASTRELGNLDTTTIFSAAFWMGF